MLLVISMERIRIRTHWSSWLHSHSWLHIRITLTWRTSHIWKVWVGSLLIHRIGWSRLRMLSGTVHKLLWRGLIFILSTLSWKRHWHIRMRWPTMLNLRWMPWSIVRHSIYLLLRRHLMSTYWWIRPRRCNSILLFFFILHLNDYINYL
jgi:hypothetical protein